MPQFLLAHEVAEYIYNVADVAYPVSIRDQMNRARWLVDKAHDAGFFGPARDSKFRCLLVCGAGAAGVTAALHAISLGVRTVLVEKSAAPFLRQRLCRSRWIDPVQYDWSANHWAAAGFPHAGPPMPLPWTADRSHRLAFRWQLRLNAALNNPLLTFRRQECVIGLPVFVRNATGEVQGVEVEFQSGLVDAYGMVLWCTGFGDERRFAPPNYTGFAFWDTDPFERSDWGVSPRPTQLRGIVSGGGDGALQDVIRLATRRKSASELWRTLLTSGWSMPDEMRHILFAAEDQAQRALLWCKPSSLDEHRALQRLHDTYVQAVRNLTLLHPARGLLIDSLTALLRANPHPLLLVHSCTHFSRCYGLNHLLVLLLEAVARIRGLASGPTFRQQSGIASVGGHACANDPWLCHGSTHTVHLQERVLCYGPPGAVVSQENANVLVIRHGISPRPAVLGRPIAFARQVMPYHLP